jgi:mono/diheme cytochrome c family protein
MKLLTLQTATILLIAGGTLALAGEVTITLPAETPVFKPAPGVDLVQANCLICHSSEYIAQQPAKPRDFWETTVKKMIEKYGAPTPPEIATPIVEYLTANYGPPAAKP